MARAGKISVVVIITTLIVIGWVGVVNASEWDPLRPNDTGPEPISMATSCDLLQDPKVWTPPIYVDLRDALKDRIDNFSSTVNTSWDGSKYPVGFAAPLSTVTAHRGKVLLNASTYWGVALQLNRLAALGLRAITVDIGFPLFDQNFTTDPVEFQGYIDFYKQVVSDIRALGLKVHVDSTVLFPEYTDLPVESYYANLTLSEYWAGKYRTLETIANELQPDFLSIGSEPDTEELITGQPVGTPFIYTLYINLMIAGLDAAGYGNLSIGAGVGTWDPNYLIYATRYGQNTNLSFIDIHIYPINLDYLDRAISIADLAHFYGKDFAIGEAWLYKARDSELSLGVTYNEIFARDAMSFFEPLDMQFIRMMVNFSHFKQALYLSPFWEKYFFAYLDYNDTIGLTPMEIQLLANFAAIAAMLNGTYSNTGHAYAVAIDETPPTTPPNFTATATSVSEITLQWSNSNDNIGVWCYRVSRDGIEISTTKSTTYIDTGLTPSTTYIYEVRAYDEAGNPSANATTSATTLDPNVNPVAAFSFSPSNPITTDIVHFTDLSTDSDGTIAAWSWNFGDSSTSTLKDPTHVYANSGLFTVILTVTDDGGLTDNETRQINVSNPPGDTINPTVIIITPTNGVGLSVTSVVVTGSASDNVAIWKVELSTDGSTWAIATGTTSWTGSVTLQEGSNTIYAKATDMSGNEATTSVIVIVSLPSPDGGTPIDPGLFILAAIIAIVLVLVLIFFLWKGKKNKETGTDIVEEKIIEDK